MNVTVHLDGIEGYLETELTEFKKVGQAAMAGRFLELTRENFGDTGTDRPKEWQALTAKYAKRVGRDHATLYVAGELFDSLELHNEEQYSEVSSNSEYAEVHQFGGGNNIPPRPFMPLTNGSIADDAALTPNAERECLQVAERAIASAIS